ncbi:hypothetical protein LC605_08575 [Nostoc sp. CHAB 5836]|uniref:hypothetical protein n=1 Tax=Nostoc sp. CHAB 5836 TaxID=2780404 RepID=UPI001E651F46|nr:hypothetical protein [Nostoc sp. CHAB 5836]MCC5615131.1 hypothetical protein [Nostoc sp. CHAB 5836]
MKNNILAIIVAAGTAVVGSSLFSAPAHAQLTTNQNVAVQITVPEVLYLRTFQTVDLAITEADLAGGTAVTTAGIGTNFNAPPTTTGATSINRTSPFTGLTGGSITKTVDELYAVWSNNPDNGIVVTLTAPGATNLLTGANGGSATIAAINGDYTGAAPGLSTPYVGGADLDLNLSGATKAGAYTGGVVNVSVTAP